MYLARKRRRRMDMDNQKIANLVIKAQQGDRDALNDLLSDSYEDFYYYALKTVKNADLAADVTQESCIEIMSTLNNLREPSAFGVWARRIIYHRCAKYFRENKNEIIADADEDGETILDTLPDDNELSLPEKVVEDKEFRKTIADMITSLPSEQSSALLLYYYERRSLKEIAEIQNTTEGTVKSRLNYGRKAIKSKIEEYESKTGTRLHSIAVLPLLLRLTFTEGAAEAMLSVPTFTGLSAGAATAATATASASGATSAATAAGTTAAKTVASVTAKKVIAGVVAATVTAGSVAGGIAYFSEEEASEPEHVHEYFSTWEQDEIHHWIECDCGDIDEKNEHSYKWGKCEICDHLKISVGLEYTETEGGYALSGIGECTDEYIVVPAEYNGLPIVLIEKAAFEKNTAIKSLRLPESIVRIDNAAFADCENLEFVDLGNSIREIGLRAFASCNKLTSINLPTSVQLIDACAFQYSGLTEIVIPEGIEILPHWLFDSCVDLETATIPKSVTSIQAYIFTNCPITDFYYNGTKSEWMAIEKWCEIGGDWIENGHKYNVHCTDGDYRFGQGFFNEVEITE